MAKVYEVAFKIGAQTAASFAKTMGSARGALGELNKSMSALGNQQAANKRVLDLRQSLSKTSQEFNAARQRVAELGAQMQRSNKPTREMKREYDRAQKSVENARQKMQQQAATLREVSKEAGATGKSTAQLVAEQDRLAKSGERASKAQAELQKNVAAQQRNLQQRSKLRGQLFDAVALGSTLVAPVKVAMDFEAAMAKVGAVAQASDEDMAKLTKTARELGATTVWSASQAAEGMTFLSMAGFNAQDTIATMPGMLSLASAAGIDLGSAADIATNMISGFRLEVDDMGRVADVLTNTFTSSNTTMTGLGETMKYVAPIAAEAGISIETVAAMAGLLGDNAIQGGQAGTALRAILNRLSGPPTEAAKALKTLGIQTKDTAGNLRDLPEILADVHRATLDLGSAEKLEFFKQIAGQEAGSAFAIMVNEAGSGNLQKFAQDVTEIGSAQRVAAGMTNNTQGAMVQLRSAMEAISITIGNVMLPVVADLARNTADVMMRFQEFANENEQLVKIIVLTTAGLIAFKVAAIAGGYAFTFIKGAALAARGAFLSARTAYLLFSGALDAQKRTQAIAVATTKAMTAAQWLLNTAMLANPLGLLIAGVLALVAAGAVLYKYWDVVVAFLKGAWQGLAEGLEPVRESLSSLQPVFNAVAGAIGWVVDAIKSLVGWFFKTEEHSEETLTAAAEHGKTFGATLAKVINVLTIPIRSLIELIGWIAENFGSISDVVRNALTSISNMLSNFNLFEMGKKMLTTLADGIKSAASVPVDAVKGALSKMRDMMPFSDAKVGPLSQLTYSGEQVMRTLSAGIKSAAYAPMDAVESGLSRIEGGLSGFADRGVSSVNNSPNITITQDIHVSGGGDTYEQVKRGAAEGARDLIRDLERALAREGRLSYG